ncbi:MAG: hypothetical protein ABW215_03355 [Kibdelosporangium sp.]
MSGENQLKVARVFDLGDPPGFAPEHPRMTGDAREWVLTYLKAGNTVMTTPGRLPDVVDPARGAVVPAGVRTDGTWVWTDTITYYLEVHGLAPDPDLLGHIEAATGPPRRSDTATLQRALAALMT